MRPVVCVVVLLGLGLSCDRGVRASSPNGEATEAAPAPLAPAVPLGLADRGIFSELDDRVVVHVPDKTPGRAEALLDREKNLLVVYQNGHPLKAYPTGGKTLLSIGNATVNVRPADAPELKKILRGASLVEASRRKPTPGGDTDKDGIPDSLDILIGAKKTVLDAAPYIGGYVKISYPNGDVPRDQGVCTDVVVRALRNAGHDLQKEVHEDIRRAPKSYPMVKRADSNIDHRRVKTILPYFKRHWVAHTVKVDDPKDPYQPGDVVFMDTFPSWTGPDHVGVVSDTRGPSGHLLVANSWAGGSSTNELDLLGWVPVTHRFRAPAP